MNNIIYSGPFKNHIQSHIELKQAIGHYPKTEILSWDWMGVNLSNEAQGVDPKITDSIQYKVIEELKKTDVDIIYDENQLQ